MEIGLEGKNSSRADRRDERQPDSNFELTSPPEPSVSSESTEPRFQFQLIDRNPFRSSNEYRYQFGLFLNQVAWVQTWSSTRLAEVGRSEPFQSVPMIGLSGAMNWGWAWGLLNLSAGSNKSELTLNGVSRPVESRVYRVSFGLEKQWWALAGLSERSFAFGGIGLSHWLWAGASPATSWLRSTAEWDSLDLTAGLGYLFRQGRASAIQLRLGAQYFVAPNLSLLKLGETRSSRTDFPQVQGESSSELAPFMGLQWYM
jgi:hypothetical protein